MSSNEFYEEIEIERTIFIENFLKIIIGFLVIFGSMLLFFLTYIQFVYNIEITPLNNTIIALLTLSAAYLLYLMEHYNIYLRHDKKVLSYLNFLIYELKQNKKTIENNLQYLKKDKSHNILFLEYESLKDLKKTIRFPFSAKGDKFKLYNEKLNNNTTSLQLHKKMHEEICRLIQLFITYNNLLFDPLKNKKGIIKLSKDILEYYQNSGSSLSLYRKIINMRINIVERIKDNYSKHSLSFRAKINKRMQDEMIRDFYRK